MSGPTIEQRLARLEAAEAIRALKARYAALADAKYRPDYTRVSEDTMRRVAWEQALCFTDDAIWEGGRGFGDSLAGRSQLHDWFQRSPWCFAVHYYGSPQLDIDEDRAQGVWRLWQLALREDNRDAVLLAATTHEDYRREADGAWRCCRMRFAGIHMTSLGQGPMPLVATLAALDARMADQARHAEPRA
ncbi:nuclear transport factor 2 family protein [Cupriavidus necator]|uniref:nuclear transport factor 2 family protein n=1 Tax=Cupriavidus necator TaxID=106590 RepID=UPI0005B30DE7|nr:nuclear transport factor 2 family protein [Cupriavidus necator]